MGWSPICLDYLDPAEVGAPTVGSQNPALEPAGVFTHWCDLTNIGNNDPVGDIMCLIKNNALSRFVWVNKDGFVLYDRHGGEFLEDCNQMSRLGIDHMSFQEPNLDFTKYSVRRKIHSSLGRVFPHHKVAFGSSPQTHLYDYKPGGTLSVTAGNMVGRIVESAADYLGRWTRTVLAGKEGSRIAVYNVYTVGNKDPKSCGPKTVIAQLYAVYVQEDRVDKDPRRNYYHDLQERVMMDVQMGYSIMLGGDFNEDLVIGHKGMSKLVQDCQLVDPIFYHHGVSNFNTHVRGSKVIDYIFVSEDLLDAIDACGYPETAIDAPIIVSIPPFFCIVFFFRAAQALLRPP